MRNGPEDECDEAVAAREALEEYVKELEEFKAKHSPSPGLHPMNLTAREMGLIAYCVALTCRYSQEHPLPYPKEWFVDLTTSLMIKGENAFTDEEFHKALELPPPQAADVAVPIPNGYKLN